MAAVNKWVRLYRLHGEEGLKDKGNGRRGPRRRADPQQDSRTQKPGTFRGIKRISQLLKRVFFLQASQETVRKTLKEQGLIEPRPSRGVTWSVLDSLSEPHPIRCGRQTSSPSAWEDVMPTSLASWMTIHGSSSVRTFRSHTAENVLEVFRVAAGEYQPPKEMLTDNGRGKINWRGITRFQAEMKKNGTHHFKSASSSSKRWAKSGVSGNRSGRSSSVERSSRASIRLGNESDSGSECYNHKRPHQGIEGLCPADRFFRLLHSFAKLLKQASRRTCLR